ncbi:class I SAM-dependent methyltransferase [Methylobacterium haplocladii]|uniref:class I SAM-dependent methyltransferase n=1 Tax=Methylobacterium haplocladii TaxID=1176176 RepID=UPI001EDD0CAC|nr:class I SAM-dependent methyltransferase [Methylobacterium haplocladii]
MPVTQDADGPNFALDLPSVAKTRPIDIAITSIGEGLLGAMTARVQPRLNAHGLAAASVLAVHDQPQFGAPWMSFDGARIVVSGSHLPPGGDPGQLSVRFGPGVAFEVAYPLPSPEFEHHFWYWPNGGLSNFQITIDLASSAAGSDPFSFEFVYPTAAPSSHSTDGIQGVGRKVYIPRRLDSAVCFPRDSNQLTRVQTWSNDLSVNFTGYSAFKTIESLFGHYGVRAGPGVTILDWGCGHGRVTRHLIQNWPEARISGADVDRQNVEWCNAHLDGDFVTLPLRPPSSIADASLDGIFGISVMTHLTADVQQLWLKEIARILKPDGVALITFAGFAAVSFASVFRSPEWWQRWQETEFDDEQHDPALDGKIDDGTYYRNTLQSPSYTLGAWGDYLEIVDIYPGAIGNQDVAVLRRRNAAKRSAS